MHLNQIRFMLYHEKERENKKNANFVYIVYLLTKLSNIFDEAFLLTSVYKNNMQMTLFSYIFILSIIVLPF